MIISEVHSLHTDTVITICLSAKQSSFFEKMTEDIA